MDRSKMTSGQNAAWNAMRSMACAMDISDFHKEIKSARNAGDDFRVQCFQALLAEAIEDERG